MRIADFDVLIVPRLGGAREGDWPSRWRARLSTARLVVPVDASATQPEAWTDAIGEAVRSAGRPVLFVGHGHGAAAVASAAFALGGGDVRGAFLVFPPGRAGLERTAGPGWSLPRAPLPWPSVVVASRTAADGGYDEVAALAADWGAELIDAGAVGGLDAESGHGPWPEGLMRLAGFVEPDRVTTRKGRRNASCALCRVACKARFPLCVHSVLMVVLGSPAAQDAALVWNISPRRLRGPNAAGVPATVTTETVKLRSDLGLNLDPAWPLVCTTAATTVRRIGRLAPDRIV